jgi:hypothetical protein
MSATNSSSAATNGINGKTPVSVLADNLMRRALRISDPSNPQEVAQGLGRAFPLESAELDEEIQGLPIGLPVPALMMTSAPASIAGRELIQAQSNIQRDLDFLTGSSQLKEVQVELQGWGETIRTWLADGAAAAPQALDAAARDRMFSARRYLLDYAWVSRLVGGQTPGLSIPYRRFARSLDEAAGLLLVSAGEALSQNNYSGDRLLLQAPASELSARADAASAALRNLSGSVQDAFGPAAWPWGLDSYRKLLERLESAGHGDIRVLLQENGLRAFTDELVDRASDVTGDGLRGLAATHVVALERVRRLIQVGVEFARESPPLAAFLSALQLFVDTFRGGDATRLITLGRPLLSSAGLYTFGGLDPGTYTLQNLVQYRSIVAQLNDSLFGTDLTLFDAEAQFVADSCLYAIDLAIDLYSVGINPEGQGIIEQRAAAYGLFIWELLDSASGPLALLPASGGSNRVWSLLPAGSSWPPSPGAPSIGLLISTLIDTINALGLSGLPRQIYPTISNGVAPTLATLASPSLLPTLPPRDPRIIAQELAIMESRHSGLLPLVSALTPGNFDPMQVLSPATLALRAANTLVGGPAPDVLRVPPPVESILVHGVHTIAPPGPPGVTSVTPTSDRAAGGTPVTLRGTGFTGATQVEFGTAIATDVRVYNDTTMRVTQSGRRRTGRRGCDLASRSVDSTQRVQVRAASHGSRSELRVEREQHSRTDLRPRLYRGHRRHNRHCYVITALAGLLPLGQPNRRDYSRRCGGYGGRPGSNARRDFTGYVSRPIHLCQLARCDGNQPSLGVGRHWADYLRHWSERRNRRPFRGAPLDANRRGLRHDNSRDNPITKRKRYSERHRGHAIWPRRGSARLFHLQLIDARTEHRYDLQDATNDRPHLAAIRPRAVARCAAGPARRAGGRTRTAVLATQRLGRRQRAECVLRPARLR